MAPSHIFQIFLRVTVQDQISITQWVIVDEVVQFGLLCHGDIQYILDPSTVNGDFSPIPEQQLHTPGIHIELTGSFIVLHVRVLSALRHLYSCDFRYTFFLIRFWTHSHREGAGACRGKAPPSCLRKTALPLKSPTGAFIAAQPRHSAFRRKQKIRTLLLSRKGSDFHCLVHHRGLEPRTH